MDANKRIYRSLFMKGMRWSFLSTMFLSVLSIVYYALLTRYLTPEDFGHFSIGIICIGFIEFFAGAGVSAVVIQMKKISDEQYSTFFWLNIGIGLFFALLLILLAPLIAAFFHAENIIPTLYILAGVSVVNGLSLLHNNILRREIQIARSEKIEMAATIVQIVSGISLAISGHAMLSLPLGFFAGKLISCLGLLWVGKKYFWPAFLFRYHSVKDQLALGSYQVFERFFNYLKANIDKILIGKYLGSESLGYYSIAQKFIDYPLSKINPSLNKVLFPYFSRLQQRPKIISKLYAKVITFLTITVTPVLIFVIFYAHEIVLVLFDSSYEKVAVLIKILSVLGLIRSFSNIGGNVLNALGKFRTGFYWNLIWSVSLTLILAISLQFINELTTFTMIVFLANFISFFVWHGIIYNYIQIPVLTLIFRFIVVCGASFGFVSILKYFTGFWPQHWPQSILLIIVSGILISATTYFTALLLKNRQNKIYALWR